jgi:tetratricopeptide (TPR) repeat protein
MQQHLLFVTIAIFCLAFSSASLAQEALPAIVKKIQPSIVVILTYDIDKKPIAQGSGFFISKDGDVITNRHVLLGARSVEVKTVDGQAYAVGSIVAEDRNGDLVRIRAAIPQTAVRHILVSSIVPEVGQRIFVIGSPLGLEQTVTDGIVSAVRQIPSFGNIIQISAPISSGSSGSPVVNLQGDVIGVASFRMIEGQNLNFAIPGKRVLDMTFQRAKSIGDWTVENAHSFFEEGNKLLGSIDFLHLEDWDLLSYSPEKINQALGFFKAAVVADPALVDAYVAIGGCCKSTKGIEEALAAYNKAISIRPNDPDLYILLGKLYKSLDLRQEALREYNRAIQLNPEYAEAYYQKGLVYLRMQATQEAIDSYRQAINKKPDFIVAYRVLINIYSNEELYSSAIDTYNQMLHIEPDDIDAHYELGILYVKLGDFESAQKERKYLLDLPAKLFRKYEKGPEVDLILAAWQSEDAVKYAKEIQKAIELKKR